VNAVLALEDGTIFRGIAAGAEGESAGEVVLGGARVPVPRFGSHAPTEGSSGAIEAMALYAGQSAGGVTGIVPAAEIVTELASRLGAPALAAAPALG